MFYEVIKKTKVARFWDTDVQSTVAITIIVTQSRWLLLLHDKLNVGKCKFWLSDLTPIFPRVTETR